MKGTDERFLANALREATRKLDVMCDGADEIARRTGGAESASLAIVCNALAVLAHAMATDMEAFWHA